MANVKKSIEENEEIKTEGIKNTKPKIESKSVAKKYERDDLIECVSITPGELGMRGLKSGINYRWSDLGDITEVEYQDLLASIRQNSSFVTAPYFIIMDEELVKQHPNIKKIYDKIYSKSNLSEILNLPVGEMEATIRQLPSGARNAIKTIAATKIQNGSLDSIRKIKALDKILGTQFIVISEFSE